MILLVSLVTLLMFSILLSMVEKSFQPFMSGQLDFLFSISPPSSLILSRFSKTLPRIFLESMIYYQSREDV